MSKPATITDDRRSFLLNAPNAITRWGQAVLSSSPASDGDERRFVLTGPSGRHSLLVAATDAARLDAHWRGFCASPSNAPLASA